VQILFDDVIIAVSLLLVAIGLLRNKTSSKAFEALNAGSFIVLFFGSAISAISLFSSTKYLFFSFVFGLFVALFIVCIADPFLTKRTLLYKNKGKMLGLTPLWMVLLWAIAITHLGYLSFRFNIFNITGAAIFIAVGFAYFLAFEVLNANVALLWERKNCFQFKKGILKGIAAYAIIAEFLTVIIVWVWGFSMTVLISVEMATSPTIPVLATAIVIFMTVFSLPIAYIFGAMCAIFYRKPKENTIASS
jgi:hypothetical protein